MHKHLLSVAPMIDCTDRHFRYLIRLISRKVLLYTEMVGINAILANLERDPLWLDPIEHPVALQLGGSDPKGLAECARLAEIAGFAEVNLNVGCPSSRVQSGGIGACLMRQPRLVADCINAMQSQVALPVTVKCRLGVDHDDSYEQLVNFVSTVTEGGCNKFIIHARKAWLKGLSPKQNRTIPPLEYEKVYRLKQDFPSLEIIINGGIKEFAEVDSHLEKTNGVMIGRAVYDNPLLLAKVDQQYYGESVNLVTPKIIINQYCDYMEQQLSAGVKLSVMARHLLGLFQGMPGAKNWRRFLSCHVNQKGADVTVIHEALLQMNQSPINEA